MKVSCIKCNKTFESLIVVQERAWHEIHEKLMTHVAVEHKERFKKLRTTTLNAQMAMGAYLAITQVAKPDETNLWLVTRMEKLVDTIMLAVGYEKDQDEEEEQEKEEKEDEQEDESTELDPEPKEADKQEVN